MKVLKRIYNENNGLVTESLHIKGAAYSDGGPLGLAVTPIAAGRNAQMIGVSLPNQILGDTGDFSAHDLNERRAVIGQAIESGLRLDSTHF
ncbi:hypothetical protein ACQE3E_23965 (plasmid) [Methylomonas sp. MED-D]|uniref:hypothetical protein n=1 Tax=Methylomonas sp. MED-D TaxID=3418768 RepID=UPI003D08BB35